MNSSIVKQVIRFGTALLAPAIFFEIGWAQAACDPLFSEPQSVALPSREPNFGKISGQLLMFPGLVSRDTMFSIQISIRPDLSTKQQTTLLQYIRALGIEPRSLALPIITAQASWDQISSLSHHAYVVMINGSVDVRPELR